MPDNITAVDYFVPHISQSASSLVLFRNVTTAISENYNCSSFRIGVKLGNSLTEEGTMRVVENRIMSKYLEMRKLR
jgi:3-oxoacyl-[acyl-carrier-protein] synthase III